MIVKIICCTPRIVDKAPAQVVGAFLLRVNMSDYTYTDKRKFYNSGVWSYARNRVLRRDAFLCQMSKRYGKFRPAKVVHHIFPLEYYPEYRLKEWNLISLSVEWHEKLHDRTGHRLSYEGWRLLEKTAAKNKITLTREDKAKCLGLVDKICDRQEAQAVAAE